MEQTIQDAIAFIRTLFAGDFSGHDVHHTLRVYRTALKLAQQEHADPLIVALAALLHDADDRKLSPETAATKANARRFLKEHSIPQAQADAILQIIGEVSFVGTDSVLPQTPEGRCVQDADRLDALGAIGIARTFAYGGNHGHPMYDPDIPPKTGMNEAEYRKHESTSVNHFYEKLFLLKELMGTAAGRTIAEKREAFMKQFMEEFYAEWNEEDC